MNKKCPSCGFINFISAAACRKCEASLDVSGNSQPGCQPASGSPYRSGYAYQHRPQSKRSIPAWVKLLAAVSALIIVVFAASVVAVVLFVKSYSKLEWQEFRPGEPGLSVMMPAPPIVHNSVTPLPGIEVKNYGYTSIVIGQGSAQFLILVLPRSIDRDKIPSDKIDKFLDDEIDNVLKDSDSDASLISKSSFTEGEVKGRSFEFKPKGTLVQRISAVTGSCT